MKKKHAERSLTGLLAAWLLLMAVWLVPGSAWARIAPNGGEATPARGAYETLVEMDVAMRGVSTAAPREGEESVAEGQREGVPTKADALRPAYAAERATPEVSAREVKPRAGTGTVHFKLGDDIKNDLNTVGLFFVVKTVGDLFGVADGKNYVFGGEQMPPNTRSFMVGYVLSHTPGKVANKYFVLEENKTDVFLYNGVEYEITVLAAGNPAQLKKKGGNSGGAYWFRKNTDEDIDIYIRRVDMKISLMVEHYVEDRKIEAPEGLKVAYDTIRQAGWDASSIGGVKVPKESTLQYSWEHGKVLVDGVAMRPKRILINGEECPIPEASKDGEAPKVGVWNVPNAASEVIIKVEWEKDLRKVTYSYSGQKGADPVVTVSGQSVANGSFISTEAVTLNVKANFIPGIPGIPGYKPFAYSVNGVVKRNKDGGSMVSLNETETLPAGKEDVNIVVHFVPNDKLNEYFIVSVDPNIEHGTVTVNTQIAKQGDVITLTVTTEAGYAAESLKVKWSDGMEDVSPFASSFTMLGLDATVKVTFKAFPGVTFTVNGGAKVTLVDAGGTSHEVADIDGDGSVMLPNVPLPTKKGTVTVEATKDGATRKLVVPVTVGADGVANPSDLTLRKVTIKVVEKDASPEVLIAGATVTAGGQTSAATEADGVATLYLVKGVDYEKTKAAAARYTDSTVTLKVDAAGQADPNVIKLAKKPVVTARVNRGATVTLVDSVGNSYQDIDTDRDGRVTLPSVPMPTKGTVTVEANGHKVEVSVEVGANGKMNPSDLTLYPIAIKVVEKDATSEKPIDGATVTVGEQKGTANGSGVATLYLVKGVSYEGVKASAMGYADSTVKLTVDSTGHTNPSVIELAKKALVNVTVTKDGATVDGATVTIVGKDGKKHEATTANGGKAAVEDVPQPTEGTVTVKKDSKVVTVPVQVDEHGVMTPSTVDLSDGNIAEVKVTVVEKGTTTGIANATVTVGAQKVQAGANGEVTLRLVKNGTYNGVTASAAGYLNDTVALTVNAAGTAVSPDKIELRKTAPVAVTVTKDGTNVDGATVTIVGKDGKKHEATTNSDGEATVKDVPVPTKGTVTVTKDGKVVTVPVTVDEHGVMDPRTVDLTEANIAPVTVTVVEKGATPEKAISGAAVTVGAQASAATGTDGVATLYLVKGATYTGVTASAAGYADSTVTLKVESDGSFAPSKIELVKTATVAVTVTDGGTGVDGARVTIVDNDGKEHGATTGADGKTTVQGVPVPTEGTVTVAKDGKVVTVPVTVDEHGVMTPATVDISSADIVAVKVTVVEKGTTTGIANATVTVGAQASAATGADGVATLRLVKNATYAGVKAVATGYEEKTETLTVKADGKADPAQIALAKKAAGQSNPYLHVFVVDENLQAIDKVSVSVKEVGFESTTDPAGHVAWQLAANTYNLTLKKKGYVTVTTSVRLEALGHDLTVVMQRVAQADPKKEDPKGQVTAVESALLAGVSLYPNPAREYTTLQGLEHADAVSILTLSGVEVQRLAVPGEREHKLDVSSLAEGIYLVVLETRGGERRVLKLVVRR